MKPDEHIAIRRAVLKRGSVRQSPSSPIKSSWESESLPASISPLSSKRRPTYLQVVLSGQPVRSERRRVVFQPALEEEEEDL